MEDSIGYSVSVENDYDASSSISSAAKAKFKKGEYDNALKLYLDLAKSEVTSKLYFDIGLCYYKLDEFNSAIEYLTESTRLDEKNDKAFSYLGNCYFKKLNANLAIENWMKARCITPQDEFVCLNLAIAYFVKNLSFESVYFYEKYLRYSKNTETEQYKSVSRNMKKKLNDAEEYYMLAQQNRMISAGSDAEINYKSSIKRYPIKEEYSFGLAELYYHTKGYKQAVEYYQLVLRSSVKNKKEIYLKIAQCCENIKDTRLAYCYYRRCLQASTSTQKEYLELARTCSSLKKQLPESVYEQTLDMANKYKEDNRYFEALVEYENYVLLLPEKEEEYMDTINQLRNFTNSEEILSKEYLKKGSELLSEGERKDANKYFTQVMHLSNPQSDLYKLAKSKIVNV